MAYEYSVTIGGTEYGRDSLRSVTIHRALFDKFSVGNAWSADIEVQFKPSVNPPRMGEIIPYVNGQQLGVYFIDERSTESGIMTIVGYDSMLKSGFTYSAYGASVESGTDNTPDSNSDDNASDDGDTEPDKTWPRSMKAVAEEIAEIMGVSMDSATSLDESLMMEYPDGYTGREILCGIAAAHAGNWIITNTGKLLLVPLSQSGGNAVNIGKKTRSLTLYTEQPPVSEVVVTIDSETFVSAGSNDGSGYTLELECPFVTEETAQTIAESVLEKLSGYVYRGLSAGAVEISPEVNLGTTIEVDGNTCMLADQIITFSSGVYSNVSAPGENEVDHEYAYQGPSTSRMNRQQKQIDDVDEKIDETEEDLRAEIDAVPRRISLSVENDEDGKSASISLLADGTPYSTAKVIIHGNTYIDGQLTAEALYAAQGDIADLLVDRLSTSRRIPRYLAGNTLDDNYIHIEGQYIYFMAGIYAGGEEQAANPYGQPIFWDADPNGENAFIGTNGYPYTTTEAGDTVPIYTTTDETPWKVMVYTYTEQVKAQWGYELETIDSNENPIYTPTIILGAGNEQGTNQARIRKSTDGLEIMYKPNNHSDGTPREEIGIKMNNSGEMEIIGYDFIRKITAEDDLPEDWVSQNRIFVIEEE